MVAAACLLAAAAASAGCPGGSRAPQAQPDVLVLVMDTTRADRCSFLGYPRPTTPRLAEFAREATSYTNAWSPSSWTYAAHAALFTGNTPSELGIVDEPLRRLPAASPTLAGILSAAGYATACFTGNAWISDATGLNRGFGKVEPMYVRAEDPPANQTHAAARTWMRAQRAAGKPFFAFINDMEVHRPRRPPDALERKFVAPDLAPGDVAAARTMSIPKAMRYSFGADPLPDGVRRANSDLYDAELAGLDAEIGTLLDGLRADGLLDRMVVVIAGDHGEGLADHVWLEHGAMVWRELLHVPLIVRLPDRAPDHGGGGGAAPGATVDELVRLQDVFPTVLEACGVEVPPEISARSLQAPLGGRFATAVIFPIPEWFEATVQAVSQEAALRFRRYRSSVCDGSLHLILEEDAPPRLYDLRTDPGETTDVAAERPADVERLLGSLPPR